MVQYSQHSLGNRINDGSILHSFVTKRIFARKLATLSPFYAQMYNTISTIQSILLGWLVNLKWVLLRNGGS